MKDNKTEFSVLVDRAIGGSSLQDGQIELMVHRYVLFFKCCFKSIESIPELLEFTNELRLSILTC